MENEPDLMSIFFQEPKRIGPSFTVQYAIDNQRLLEMDMVSDLKDEIGSVIDLHTNNAGEINIEMGMNEHMEQEIAFKFWRAAFARNKRGGDG